MRDFFLVFIPGRILIKLQKISFTACYLCDGVHTQVKSLCLTPFSEKKKNCRQKLSKAFKKRIFSFLQCRITLFSCICLPPLLLESQIIPSSKSANNHIKRTLQIQSQSLKTYNLTRFPRQLHFRPLGVHTACRTMDDMTIFFPKPFPHSASRQGANYYIRECSGLFFF